MSHVECRVGKDAVTPLKFLMEKAVIQVAPVHSGQTELEASFLEPRGPVWIST